MELKNSLGLLGRNLQQTQDQVRQSSALTGGVRGIYRQVKLVTINKYDNYNELNTLGK